MFSVGDLVQPRAGGPKLKVVEVQGEQLVVVQAAQEQGDAIPGRGRLWRLLKPLSRRVIRPDGTAGLPHCPDTGRIGFK